MRPERHPNRYRGKSTTQRDPACELQFVVKKVISTNMLHQCVHKLFNLFSNSLLDAILSPLDCIVR